MKLAIPEPGMLRDLFWPRDCQSARFVELGRMPTIDVEQPPTSQNSTMFAVGGVAAVTLKRTDLSVIPLVPLLKSSQLVAV